MTLQSLRKLLTTQWSTRQKTNAIIASGGLARCLRDSALAGLALITLTSGAMADNASRCARLGPWRPVLTPTSASSSAVTHEAKSSSIVRVNFEATVDEAHGDSLTPPPAPPELMTFDTAAASSNNVAASPVLPALAVAPEMSSESGSEVPCESCSDFTQTEGCDSNHTSRMKYLLSGGIVNSSASSVGDWWQQRSQRMLEGNRFTNRARRKEARQSMANSKDRLIDRITLPDDPELDVDFYDANPKTVMAPIVQASGEQADGTVNSTNSSAGSSRLNTDITSIKPTLSYAMKNIDRSQLPRDFDDKIDNGQYAPRESSAKVLQWAPTNLYHYPLYFEDPSLERYGHAYHPLVQPFASYGRFATQLVGLPYQMALHPVNSKQYTLGYYRPGECAPKKHYQIPFNEEATIVEVATIIGFILIFP